MNIEIDDSFKNEFKLKEGDNVHPLVVQEYVYIKLANTLQNIQYDLPSFCILGAFTSESEGRYILEHQLQCNQDIFKIRMHTLFPICVDKINQVDAICTHQVINTKVNMHMDNKRKKDHSFYSRIYKCATSDTIDKQINKTQVDGQDRSTYNLSEIQQLDKVVYSPQNVKKYEFAVMTLLDTDVVTIELNESVQKDTSNPHKKEPVISILALFENIDSAETYCKHTASHQYPLCDIYIVDTNKWCSPYVMDTEAIREVYRNSRLDDIMTMRKEELLKVDAFERSNVAAGIPIPEIVINS
jgi:hypothetical protein